ncbi:MAG: hypothetical protein ABIK62_00695 [candidate division WOR-3 bacterium]
MIMQPNCFQTGRVLGTGNAEIEVRTYALTPVGASLALGLVDSIELRLGAGRIGVPLAACVSMNRPGGVSPPWYVSEGASAELLFPHDRLSVVGFRLSGLGSVGFYPSPQFGLYLPGVASVIYAKPYTARDSVYFEGLIGGSVTPGLGLSYEYENVSVRLAGNVPISVSGSKGMLAQVPYLGLQFGYRFRGY